MVNSGILGGGDVFPVGFRFHPTDEELVLYYLKRKICGIRHHLDVIGETDVYKWDPEDLPGMSKLKTGDRIWFFFTPRDRKYPNGMRSNRATGHGYWKVTGKDRVIKCGSRAVGIKKTLVFYRGHSSSGERTDWVMHEYTMDEDELKRCQTNKQYYALYKVFKKSGAGPKNGEQYGAAFVEEDWDELEVNLCIELENVVNGANGSVQTINNIETVNTLCPSSLDELEGILNEIPVEPIPVQQKALNFEYAPDQLADKDEIWGNSVEHSYGNVSLPVLQAFCEPPEVLACFDLIQSGTTQLQFGKAREASSAPIDDMKDPLFTEEDFIEMYDLIGPDPTTQIPATPVNSVESLQLNELDGLTEFEIFQDTSSFFHDMEHVESTQLSELHMNTFDNGVMDPVPSSCLTNLEGIYSLRQHFDNYDGVSYQQWTDEQSCSVVTDTDPNLGFVPPLVSGTLHENKNQNYGLAANESGSGRQDDGNDSWCSSALWSFVESIPTTPASACENPLVNRALQRISSFSRVRINNANDAGGGSVNATSRSAGKSRIGLICFSLIGVLFAVVCMLNSNTVRVD